MSSPVGAPAVLLDRDGVINKYRVDYVKSWSEFQFLDGALDALRCLAATKFKVAVVSNQSAIGHKVVERQVLEDIHGRMLAEIASAGGRVDRVYYCPHRPDEGCECRKPRPGLLFQASRELGLDLSRSFFVGDSYQDVAAGVAAGCTPILVRTGRGETAANGPVPPGIESPVIVQDLNAAVMWILGGEGKFVENAAPGV
jgi:D-glycero-D-manno-heptose 1,7-bisphosphate phosphatase